MSNWPNAPHGVRPFPEPRGEDYSKNDRYQSVFPDIDGEPVTEGYHSVFPDPDGEPVTEGYHSVFPDPDGEAPVFNPPKMKKNPSIWDERNENLRKVLDLIIYGTPISQLLFDKRLGLDLTERGVKELTTLLEKAYTDRVVSLKEEIVALEKKKQFLTNNIDSIKRGIINEYLGTKKRR